MTLGAATYLAVQAACFSLWIVLVFRWLFAIRADAVAESGNAMPGFGPTIRAFRGAWTDARYAKNRMQVGILTLLLLVLSSFAPLLI